MTDQAIALSGVEKRYGAQKVLRGVSLSVAPGECVALLGHNGAGKTTLMKIMLGMTKATRGEVRVLGASPGTSEAAAARKDIGFLPENVRFHENMTGAEVLAFYARLKGAPLNRNQALFEKVDLAEAARSRVKTYSKGMRQRLGLAQALLGKPRLLLLDEPTSGLDPLSRHGFYGIIEDLTKTGTAVFLSSHALTELEASTERIAIMNEGLLVADGSLRSLRRSAELPVRICVSVPPGERDALMGRNFSMKTHAKALNGQTVQLTCEQDHKVALVRQITELGCAIEDIDILPPTLDEIYANYGRKGGAAQ